MNDMSADNQERTGAPEKTAAHHGLALEVRQDAPIPLQATLDCAPGELLALVGPSGSGKTTLLRVIAGLYRPARSLIRCNGTSWADSTGGVWLPPQARRAGLVFQDYALFPNLSARENLAIAMQQLPEAERNPRAESLLARVNLHGLGDRRPSQLSGGQQQRVALARALARDPAVLLLDEPFAAVDQVTRRKLQQELAQLRASVNIPIVLVTHDLTEAAALADRMVVLHHGQTLQQGTPAEVMQRPCSPLVARLMDQMNVFEAEVLDREPRRTLLRWGSNVLEAAPTGDFSVGESVAWLIPPSHILLHRRDRPSRGERENPLPGRVSRFVAMGETAHIAMTVDGHDGLPLQFSVSLHVARRNGLREGVRLVVSLLAEGIHLMRHDGGREH
jgi:molybdate transport system ATP-binding protein